MRRRSHRSRDAVALLRQTADVGAEVPGVGRLEVVGEPSAGVPGLTDDESSVRRIVGSRWVSVGRITGGGPTTSVVDVFVVVGADAAAAAAAGRVRVVEVVPAIKSCD